MEDLSKEEQKIIQEELINLKELQKSYDFEASGRNRDFLMKQIIDLNESISDVNSDDLPQINEQLKRLNTLVSQNDMIDTDSIDLLNPYFAHMRLRDEKGAKNLYLGTKVYKVPDRLIQVIDWKTSPISIIYFLYEEGDAYEEEIEGRLFAGEVELKRILRIDKGEIIRIQQGNLVLFKDSGGAWQKAETQHVLLQGGAGTAPRADNTVTVDPKLGIERTGEIRRDKLLPEITALIAPDQYELITQPGTGIVAIQGTAGSGKTTIALHRVAWLHFREPHRFRADRMMVMVFNKALANYISKVLPSLGVKDVEIDFFENWATKYRRRLLSGKVPARYSEHTPVSVIRFKKHPALLKIIKNFIREKKTSFEKRLNQILQARDCQNFPLQELNSMSLISRSFALDDWIEGKIRLQGKRFDFNVELRNDLLRLLKDYTAPDISRVEMVVRYWEELFSDFEFLKKEFLKLTDALTEAGLDDIIDWLKYQYTQRYSEDEKGNADLLDLVSGNGGTSRGGAALDYEDDPILLYFYQELFKDIPKSKNTKLLFSHLMIDEVQDFSPIELAVLLNVMDKNHTLTMAGDINQKMIEFSGFHDWDSMFDTLGVKGQKISSLKIGYRSTFEIMDFSLSVLGNLASDKDFLATRSGPPVELFGLSGQGELIQLLTKSLKDLLIAEPFASIAIICVSPQDAADYFSMLDRMEIPDLRLVSDQDFPFTPGIDITDIKQVKGLEFDYVILLDVDRTNYPNDSYSRYLLHIAASRAAHQLWLMNYRESSPLLPEILLDRIIR